MTALVLGAVPFHLWASGHGLALYSEWSRLANLLMLVVVSRGEVYQNIYGPKRSLPDWAWKQAHVLMFLSFLTVLVIALTHAYLSRVSESLREILIKVIGRAL